MIFGPVVAGGVKKVKLLDTAQARLRANFAAWVTDGVTNRRTNYQFSPGDEFDAGTPFVFLYGVQGVSVVAKTQEGDGVVCGCQNVMTYPTSTIAVSVIPDEDFVFAIQNPTNFVGE